MKGSVTNLTQEEDKYGAWVKNRQYSPATQIHTKHAVVVVPGLRKRRSPRVWLCVIDERVRGVIRPFTAVSVSIGNGRAIAKQDLGTVGARGDTCEKRWTTG